MSVTVPAADSSQAQTDRKPILRPWDEYRHTLTWKSTASQAWGFRAGLYEPIQSSQLQAHVVWLPGGHAAPVHRASTDLILVQLTGELDLIFREVPRRVRPCDMLVIPANTPYALINSGFDDTMFFAVHERSPDGGPLSTTYRLHPAEEGWEAPADVEITHLEWESYRRQVHYRGGLSEIYGYHRGVYPIVETDAMRGHPVRVPAGQGSPWKTVPGDGIFVGMVGEVELYGNSFTDTKAYLVGPRDLLMMPGPVWALQNPGLTDAVYFSVSAKPSTPFKMTYFEPAVPGNPIAGPGAEVAA